MLYRIVPSLSTGFSWCALVVSSVCMAQQSETLDLDALTTLISIWPFHMVIKMH